MRRVPFCSEKVSLNYFEQSNVSNMANSPRNLLRLGQKRLINITTIARDQNKKNVASPLYSEAARFLKKDWVVKNKSLDKFASERLKQLDSIKRGSIAIKKEIELRALRKNMEGRLLIHKGETRFLL